MKVKQRICSLLLVLLLVVNLMPTTVLAEGESANSLTVVTTLAELQQAITDGQNPITIGATIDIDSAVTIQPAAETALTLTRAAELTGPMFHVKSGTLTLTGQKDYRLTIDGNGVAAADAAIVVEGGTASFTYVTVQNCYNAVGNGGAISLQSGSLTLTNCDITDNCAAVQGGGVYYSGGDFSLNRTINIVQNTVNGNGNNLYIARGNNLSFISSGLNSNNLHGRIGITTEVIPMSFSNSYYDASYDSAKLPLFSDRAGTTVYHTSSNSWWLKTDGTHKHCDCGDNSYSHTHSTSTWNGVTSLDLIDGYSHYYLLNDVSVPAGTTWTPPKNTILCLNGHKIIGADGNDVITIASGSSFVLTDCQGTGQVTHTNGASGRGITNNGVFAFWNGAVTGNTFTGDGAGIYNTGTLRLYGGNITHNTAVSPDTYNYKYSQGGGLYNENKASDAVIINGSTFDGNSAYRGGGIYNEQGTITMESGSIQNNTGTATGGGVHNSAYYPDMQNAPTKLGTFIMKGGSITGNHSGSGGGISNGGTVQITGGSITSNAANSGGGIGNGTNGRIEVSNCTISDNTANSYGGGIATSNHYYSTSGVFIGDGTVITKNHAPSGGGLYVWSVSQPVTLSGKVIIIDNTESNLYISAFYESNSNVAHSSTISASGLTSGSQIGVTTGKKLAASEITNITNDRTDATYFTSDLDNKYYFENNWNGISLVPYTYSVNVTSGANMTAASESGSNWQKVIRGDAIVNIVRIAKAGYYFPVDYGVTASNGITVTRNSATQITISGTPTADSIQIKLPDASPKLAQDAPTGLTGISPTTRDGVDGAISGTTTEMEYSTDGTTWTDCTANSTVVGVSGTYQVRYKETDSKLASASTSVTVPQLIDIPNPTLTYTYDGTEKTLLASDEAYTISGDNIMINAGTYTVTIKLNAGYKWSDGSTTDRTYTWTIESRTLTADDFTFAPPADLMYDGNGKQPTLTCKFAGLDDSDVTITYIKGNSAPKNAITIGTYKVIINIAASQNFNEVKNLSSDLWTFTILHDHAYTGYQHNETDHWQICTVPECNYITPHEAHTGGTATCTTLAVCNVCSTAYGTLDPNNHVAAAKIAAKAPTCTEKGNTAYWYCSDCGKYFADDNGVIDTTTSYDNTMRFSISALNHKNAVKTDAVAATCTTGGNDAYWYCDDCGKYFADDNNKLNANDIHDNAADFNTLPLNHAAAKLTVAKAVTCTADGNDAYWYCDDCGKYFADNNGALDATTSYADTDSFTIQALDHKNATHVNAIAPTCTTKGNTAYYYCSDCGKYFAEKNGVIDKTTAYDSKEVFDLAPLNHKAAVKTDAVAATCTTGGNDAYWYCDDCGKYFADDNGMLDANNVHDSAADFNTLPLNHAAAKLTVAKAVTCTTDGHKAYWYCSDCGKYFADNNGTLDATTAYTDTNSFTIKALDHKNATRVAAVAPTCTTKGNEAYYYCSDCGKYFAEKNGVIDKTTAYDNKDGFDLAPLNHKAAVKTDAIAATCTTGGNDAYWYCDDCGKYFADNNGVLDATTAHDNASDFNTLPLNHAAAKQTAAKAVTCTADGHEAYWYCSDCGKYFADNNGALDATTSYTSADSFTIKALDHKNATRVAAVAPTCTTKGNNAYYYCSDCYKYFAEKNGVIDKTTAYDSKEVFDLAPLNHKAAVKTDAVAATCTTGGNDAYWYCDDCGKYFADNNGVLDANDIHDDATDFNTNAFGHDFTDYVFNNDATYDADGTETATCNHGCGTTDTRVKTGSKLIDSEAPVVTGIEAGKTYCLTAEATITDVNLDTVTLNGEIVTLTDGKLTIAPMAGEQILVASDRFGNSTTVKFTVNAEHTADEGVITTPATAATEGVKTFTCTICGSFIRTEAVAKLAPTIVEGANGTYKAGTDKALTFRSDAALDDFTTVLVDGKELSKSDYTVSGDGITIVLSDTYLNKLDAGEHTLTIRSISGDAKTTFTVKEKAQAPHTGDTNHMMYWLALLAVSGLGMTLTVVSRKKR